MRVGITGFTGFIGEHLTAYLTRLNFQMIPLGRGLLKEDSFRQLVETIEDCDIVINLAGATVNRRWTVAYKDVLCDSRIGTTSRLVSAIKCAKRKPGLLISASAVGYYPAKGSFDEYDEVVAEGFLASLCREWEAEARKCCAETRVVIVRLGVVLALDGGAMQQMISPLIRTKISTVIGCGEQAFPWIAIQDVCKAIHFFIGQEGTRGIYNLVSPQQITQKYLAYVLAQVYGAWFTLPVPGLLFRIILGERSTMLIQGQRVNSSRLLEAGYVFLVSTVEQLLSVKEKE